VRISFILVLTAGLLACGRGTHSNEAVKQAVIDHLTKVGINVAGMDVSITSVQFNGKAADADVSMAPKGNAAGGMSMKYHLEDESGKWVVKGRPDSGASPHGGGAMPDGASPHGGGAIPGAGGTGKMPSPSDLPPTKKQ
jgi:hypothetical protein